MKIKNIDYEFDNNRWIWRGHTEKSHPSGCGWSVGFLSHYVDSKDPEIDGLTVDDVEITATDEGYEVDGFQVGWKSSALVVMAHFLAGREDVEIEPYEYPEILEGHARRVLAELV